MTNTMKTVPFLYEATKDANEAAAKTVNSYAKVYEVWFKSVDALSREQFEIGRRTAAGETVETTRLFELMSETFDNLSKAMAESVKGIVPETRARKRTRPPRTRRILSPMNGNKPDTWWKRSSEHGAQKALASFEMQGLLYLLLIRAAGVVLFQHFLQGGNGGILVIAVFARCSGAAAEAGIDLRNAEALEFLGINAAVGEDIRDGAGQSAVHQVVFQHQDVPGLFDRFDDQVFVHRFDGIHVDDADV